MMSATWITPLALMAGDSLWPPTLRRIIRAEMIPGYLFRTLILASGDLPAELARQDGTPEVIPGPRDYRGRREWPASQRRPVPVAE